jgi:hemerythrin superfamily protein
MKMANMDAIALLTADHQEVKSMFREIERANDRGARQDLCRRIVDALKLHTAIEEEIFYPAVQQHLPDLIAEARQEHKTVDGLLSEISNIQVEDVRFDELMRDVIKNVEHHAGEEESQMFPQCKDQLGMDELNRLGEQLMQRKQRGLRRAA